MPSFASAPDVDGYTMVASTARTVGGWCDTRVALEQLVEPRQIAEPRGLSDLGDRRSPMSQQMLGALESNPKQVRAERNAHYLVEAVR